MENPFEVLEQKLGNIEKLLLSMQKQEQPQQPETDSWLSINQLIDYLPDKPARATIYGKVHNRLIPFHKQGKSLIFRKSEIDSWLGASRIKTTAEIEEEANNYIK